MLQPKKTKFRKFQKRKVSGIKKQSLNFGMYGIQALDCGRLSAACIEATRHDAKLKELVKQIRVFPDLGVLNHPKLGWVKVKVY